VIAGIIGIALTRLVINQARFVASQDGMMRARASARAALNVLNFEMRGVSTGGVVAATIDSVDVRVPYAYGVACGYSSGTTALSLVPPDSATWQNALTTTSGYAYQATAGTWTFVDGATRTSGSTATCYSASPPINVLYSPGGTAWGVYVSGIVPVGSIVYIYQKVRYAFGPSVQLPGRRALWRTTLATNAREELVVPFDTSAHFNFLTGSMLTSTAAVPASLDSIRGVRLILNTQSEDTPQGRSIPLLFRMTSDIVFKNHDS
jgi:hypothetical protein